MKLKVYYTSVLGLTLSQLILIKELKESAERLGRLIGGLLKYLDGKK